MDPMSAAFGDNVRAKAAVFRKLFRSEVRTGDHDRRNLRRSQRSHSGRNTRECGEMVGHTLEAIRAAPVGLHDRP